MRWTWYRIFTVAAWLFGGLSIASHVYMLIYGLPERWMAAHAVMNIAFVIYLMVIIFVRTTYERGR